MGCCRQASNTPSPTKPVAHVIIAFIDVKYVFRWRKDKKRNEFLVISF